MSVAVYTCITGQYDQLKIPELDQWHLPFYCFTDRPTESHPPWTMLQLDLPGLNPKDKSRYIKMHPHQVLDNYDATLYIDGSIQVVGELGAFVSSLLERDGDVFAYEHPERNCSYLEAEACSFYGYDWLWTLASQMNSYRREGFPMASGLFEAGVMFRRNNVRVNELMEMWWQEYQGGVKRDQISLPYLSWKNQVPIVSLGGSDPRFANRFFRFIEHPSRRRYARILRSAVNRLVLSMRPGSFRA